MKERYQRWLILTLPLLLFLALYSPYELTRYILRYIATWGYHPEGTLPALTFPAEMILVWLPWPALITLPFVLRRILRRKVKEAKQ